MVIKTSHQNNFRYFKIELHKAQNAKQTNKQFFSCFFTNKFPSKLTNSWLLLCLPRNMQLRCINENISIFFWYKTSAFVLWGCHHTVVFHLISPLLPCFTYYLTSHIICFSTLGKFLLIMQTWLFVKWTFLLILLLRFFIVFVFFFLLVMQCVYIVNKIRSLLCVKMWKLKSFSRENNSENLIICKDFKFSLQI